MAYENKYLADCKTSFWNRSIWTYIQERDIASGQSETIDVPYDEPQILKITAEDETLETPIRGSKLTTKLESITDQKYVTLFTSDARRFKMLQYWKNDYYWYGWLVPELYSEPHKPVEYPVSLPGTDGLGVLKDVEWKDSDGELFTGKQEILQTIIDIIARTDLELNILESCYIYESNINSTDDDSPLAQIYFNAEIMMDGNKPKSCYDVLEILLRRFHLTVRQWNGSFQIIQINAQVAEYTRRRFLYDGTFVNSHSFDPIIDITTSDEPNATFCGYIDDWAVNTILPAWKELILTQDYGLDDNLINDKYYYRGQYAISLINTEYPEYNNGLLFLPARYPQYEDRYIESDLGDFTAGTNFLDIDIKIHDYGSVIGKVYLYLYTTTGHNYYLNSEGEWVYDSYTPIWESGGTPIGDITATSGLIPASGSLHLRFVTINNLAHQTTTPRFIIDIGNSKITFKSRESAFPEEVELTTTINNNNNFSGEYETNIGDLPGLQDEDLIYRGGLYYKDGDDYIPTSEWYKKGESGTGTLNEIISDEICKNHLTPKVKREGKILGEFGPINIIQEGGQQFMIIGDEIHFADDFHNIVMVQIGGETGYLQLKSGGYFRLKGGGRIKLKSST